MYIHHVLQWLLHPVWYCDEHVCVSACWSVCLSASISPKLQVQSSPILNMYMDVAWSPLVVLRYAMYFRFMDDVMFAHNGQKLTKKAFWKLLTSTGLTPQTTLKVIHQGQHRTGDGVCYIRVVFKLIVTVHRCLNGRAPNYLLNRERTVSSSESCGFETFQPQILLDYAHNSRSRNASLVLFPGLFCESGACLLGSQSDHQRDRCFLPFEHCVACLCRHVCQQYQFLWASKTTCWCYVLSILCQEILQATC